MKLKRVMVVVVALLLLFFSFLSRSLWRSIPPLTGRVTLPGLADSVVVGFDALGVPHLRAASDRDAMTALGYLHARDRMFAMDIMRRAAEGRLSEVLGGAALSTDRFLRTLDITGAARASLGVVPDSTRALLEAYAAGVNRWIAEPGRPLPPEFRVLRYRPEPWTPLQSVEIARLMSWDLVTAGAELRLARVALDLGAERAAELVPWYPEDGPTIVGRGDRGTAGETAVFRPPVPLSPRPPVVPDLAAAILSATSLRSSNAWVISGSRTASGKPILANDPHLGLRAPSLWYLLSVETPTLRAWGAGIPGLPGVVLGRNARIAWGLTNVSADDVDYVIERLSLDSSRVLTATGWQPVEVRRDSIRVKGRPAVPFAFRRTGHGPLIEAGPPAGAVEAGEVRALAMRWNAHDPSDELSAIWGVMRAGNWNEFLAAVRGFKSPEQNWVYADVDGNIGYTASGSIAVRRSGQGLFPTAGWTDEGRWDRYLTFDELPRVLNPAEGFIVTANNRVIGRGYPYTLATGWELPYRAARIREMILADSSINAEDVRRMQLDSVDVFARGLLPLAVAAAQAAGRADVAEALRAWDGTAGGDRVEPSVFYAWYRMLQRLTFDDELGGYRPSSPFHGMLAAGESRWFDDVRTSETETLAVLATRAMREALPLADGKPWRTLHRTVSEHTLGPARPLQVLLRLNVGPFQRSGSPYTVNVAGFSEYQPPFTNTHAASLRHVSDMADTVSSGLVITTGQSGNPLSRRYRDQAGRWMRGELWRMGAGIDGSMSVLRLVP